MLDAEQNALDLARAKIGCRYLDRGTVSQPRVFFAKPGTRLVVVAECLLGQPIGTT